MDARGDLGRWNVTSDIGLENRVRLRIAKQAVDPVFRIGRFEMHFAVGAGRRLRGVGGHVWMAPLSQKQIKRISEVLCKFQAMRRSEKFPFFAMRLCAPAFTVRVFAPKAQRWVIVASATNVWLGKIGAAPAMIRGRARTGSRCV
jgi:hypothetical protein